MNQYKIVTVCDRIPMQPYYCLQEWAKSLQGVPPLILGTTQGSFNGLGSKPKLLLKAINDGEVKEKYTIFVDCWDLVFARHPDMVWQNFILYNSPIVISSERNCFPADLKEQYDALPYTSEYKYLNSGMICAETEALKAALEAMNLAEIPYDYYDADAGRMVHINDQELWQHLFLKQPVPMVLDYNQLLCNCLQNVTLDDLDFTDTFIRNKETGMYPLIFHLNGSSKTDGLREPILKHLGL